MALSHKAVYESPFGPIELTIAGGKLARVRLRPAGEERPAAPEEQVPRAVEAFFDALGRYFRGEALGVGLETFELGGATDFQRNVYRELMDVAPGELVSYGDLAARVGLPKGARAVGRAVARNPMPIFIPCHRVVAQGRRPGGFGAGPRWKMSLLQHEGWYLREGELVRTENEDVKTCVYAGSFDPPTMGHMYMIKRGAEMFGRLIVAVGINPNKKYTFTLQERLEMLRECTRSLANVEVDGFKSKLLVRYAESRGARYILRGIRSDEDYRFEHTMRNLNEDLAPQIATVFLIPPRQICELSSGFVKGLVGFEGWQQIVKSYVPAPVYEKLLAGDITWRQQGGGPEGGAK